MQPQNAITQEMFNEIFRAAVAGKSRDTIIQNMRQKGIPAQTAESVTAQAFRLKKKVYHQQGKKFILAGLLMLGAGVLITGISYFIASAGLFGGSFIITGGFIVMGIINIFRGLLKVIAN